MSHTFKSVNFFKVKNPVRSAAAKDQSRIEESKRKRGLSHFQLRNIQESPDLDEPVAAEPKVDDRKVWLLKWKEEKRKKMEEEKMKKKPVFKAGVVSHSVGSPYFKVFNDAKKNMNAVNKHKFQFRLAKAKLLPKLTKPVAPKFSERKTTEKIQPIEDRRVLRSNATKENAFHVVNQPARILRSKTVDPVEVKNLKMKMDKVLSRNVRTPPPHNALNDISNVGERNPARTVFSPFSPNVCLTRGKRRPVRSSDEGDDEEKKKKKESRHRTRIANTHFDRLSYETQRLHSVCNKWNNVVKTENLPEDSISEIDALTGKTRLLTTDKFMQFRRLVEQFEGGNADPPITPDDLTGFWEMVYLQVDELDQKFKHLEDLKSNGWKEISKPKSTNQSKKAANKPPSKIVRKPAASSSLKSFLAAARQNKDQSKLPDQELKTFDAVMFQVVSPVAQSPVLRRKSDINTSLLRQVLSSGSKLNSPRLSAMNAVRKSILAKSITSSPAVIMDQTKATPRSILRKSVCVTAPTTTGNCKKSLRFGPPVFQSASSVDNDSSFDSSSVPVVKKLRKVVGTPYRKLSLDETFSMDENESPSPKAQNNKEMSTPVRRSSRLHQENEASKANGEKLESLTPVVTPLRRSTRLSEKMSEYSTPLL